FQEAIDDIVANLMREHNRKEALIYNTVQMYRVDRLAYLKDMIAKAKKENFFFGVKLVRGAYMEKERQRAAEQNYPSPIHKSKAATDKSYDEAAEFLVDNIERVAVYLGTHNEKSVQSICRRIDERKLGRDDKRCYFSQLFGMSENLTYNLA